MKKNKGFTLIELLVVMAIIAVLSALSLAGLTVARRSARDTQRRNDLDQYKKAIESYSLNHCSKYPVYGGASLTNGNYLGISTGAATLCGTHATYWYAEIMVDKYLPTCLYDPASGRNSITCDLDTYYQYCYIASPIGYGTVSTGCPAATEYYLATKLEGGGFWVVCSNNKTGKITGTTLKVGGAYPAKCPLP